MKVLFINTVYDRGSTGRIVADLGQMLEEHGHEFMVAYGRGDNRNDQHCYRIGSDFDMYLHAALARITDRAGFFSQKATRHLIEFIKEYNPDIIHLHNLHGYYLNIEILFNYLANEYKGRVIWTLHDCWAFTGHCVHYTYAGCNKWKTGCDHCIQKHEYPASLICDSSKRNYLDKKRLFTSVRNLEIITVSNWLKDEVKKSYLQDYNIKCIYNGVDTEKFKPVQNHVKEELGIKNKKMILLVSDGWTEQKGYSLVRKVAKEAPSDWRFVMIGLTSRQIKELPQNIIGFERIWNQQKLIEFYSAADVFLNPSLEETFGLVTAEALACGTLAVVMNSTACPELIVDSINGDIINKDSSIEKIINLIQSVLSQTKKNYFFVFSKKIFLEKYYNLYKNVIYYNE